MFKEAHFDQELQSKTTSQPQDAVISVRQGGEQTNEESKVFMWVQGLCLCLPILRQRHVQADTLFHQLEVFLFLSLLLSSLFLLHILLSQCVNLISHSLHHFVILSVKVCPPPTTTAASQALHFDWA